MIVTTRANRNPVKKIADGKHVHTAIFFDEFKYLF
jgi:hypothetical protein